MNTAQSARDNAASPHTLPEAEEGSLHELVLQSLDDDQAQDIVSIDLEGKSGIADFMVIANGTSKRQVGAMADHLQRKIKASGLKGLATEGLDNCGWVLIDAGDVIVHLFRPEVRDFYSLEKIWTRPGTGRDAASGVGA